VAATRFDWVPDKDAENQRKHGVPFIRGLNRGCAMRACAISPDDRRDQVKRVGDDLVKQYGKKSFYTVEEVKQSNRRCNISLDFGCWSHATFNTHKDFDAFHHSIGEQCDYVSMKSEMLSSVSSPGDTSILGFDFDLSWLDFPNIDLSIFDFFDVL
jgi:hypothetical protein